MVQLLGNVGVTASAAWSLPRGKGRLVLVSPLDAYLGHRQAPLAERDRIASGLPQPAGMARARRSERKSAGGVDATEAIDPLGVVLIEVVNLDLVRCRAGVDETPFAQVNPDMGEGAA